MTIIEDSKWKLLTSHQQHRLIKLSADTTLAEINEFVGTIKSPFKGNTNIEWSIKADTLKVHAQLIGKAQ